ncbi:MAG TPA: amidohydrolase family protein [Thermoanaerobaculia bacterium]|nr:amidohydrolase family protein [Thermoanaerobaculia bacterium]
MKLRRLAVSLSFLFAAALRADAPGVYAITGGTVHTAAGADIANGTVVIRDGLIEAIGASVAAPADATVIDAKGAHVYPGLIDAQTSFGIASPKDKSEPTADALAVRVFKASDDELDARRRTGVTTIVTAPSYGIFQGQSAILNLGNGALETQVIKSPAAMQIAFLPRATWTFPDSLMGVIADIRQTLLDAQQYAAARDLYDKAPAGLQRPAESAALAAFGPVLRRDLPVVFIADSELMMQRALKIARESNLRIILSGARQAYRMNAAELKGVSLLVSVNWPAAPANKDDREEQPLRVIRDRQLQPTTPSVLVKNGAMFALVSGSGKTGDFLPGIRKAIDNGLSADDALRATTLWPARIFGIDRQLGSLERGKIANVVVSDKPLFTKDAKVTRVFVDGRELRLPAEEKKEEKTASPIDGTWSLSVRAPEGNIAITLTLRTEDGKLSGTFSGDRGSGDIRGGTFTDNKNFELTLSAAAQNAEAEHTDWIFRGTVDGDAMQGNVTTTIGTWAFTGSRSK